MRLLVTGGAGFIGSHFVRSVLTDAYPALAGAEVTVLDSFSYAGRIENLAPVGGSTRLRVVRGDITDAAAVDDVLPGHDAVVHFAAESHVDRSIAASAVFVTTNVLGTHTLVDAALRHGVDTFVHVSTDEVYGSIERGSWPETDPVAPNSPYAASKAASDLVALAHHRTHGLDVRVTRCSNNYGPYQFPEKVIPLFITNLLDDRPVPLYGDGLNSRDWLHVDDHCAAIALVLAKGRAGEIYNIGGGTELTNRELTDLILNACGRGPEMIRPVADRKGHDRRYSVDCRKIETELGYEPRHRLSRDLPDLVAWYAGNRAWWESLRPPA